MVIQVCAMCRKDSWCIVALKSNVYVVFVHYVCIYISINVPLDVRIYTASICNYFFHVMQLNIVFKLFLVSFYLDTPYCFLARLW